MRTISTIFSLAILLASPLTFSASNSEEALQELKTQWAISNYQDKDKAQKESFEQLLISAAEFNQQYPNNASLLIWSGIIKSTYAGVKGGLGALKLAKSSKADFEQAMAIDNQAQMGSAYTSLGILYFNVPGWPLGFGDSEKAEELLKTALSINPDGIDPNYFYADYLKNQSRYQEAEQYLLAAMKAPARPDRPLADQGRQQEIIAALTEVRKHLD